MDPRGPSPLKHAHRFADLKRPCTTIAAMHA